MEKGKGIFFCFVLVLNGKFRKRREREGKRLVWREEKFREKRKIIIHLNNYLLK